MSLSTEFLKLLKSKVNEYDKMWEDYKKGVISLEQFEEYYYKNEDMDLWNFYYSVIKNCTNKNRKADVAKKDSKLMAQLYQCLYIKDIDRYYSNTFLENKVIPGVIEQVSANYKMPTPEFIVDQDYRNLVVKKIFPPKDAGYILPYINTIHIVENDRIFVSDKNRFYGQSASQMTNTIAHEASHIDQDIKIARFFDGDESVHIKYKLMAYEDIFNTFLENVVLKKSDKIKSYLLDSRLYWNSVDEIDARINAMNFMRDLYQNEYLSAESKNLLLDYLHEDIYSQTSIDDVTGDMMLEALAYRRNMFAKYYGETELGQAVVAGFDELYDTQETKDYAESINILGRAVMSSYNSEADTEKASSIEVQEKM